MTIATGVKVAGAAESRDKYINTKIMRSCTAAEGKNKIKYLQFFVLSPIYLSCESMIKQIKMSRLLLFCVM